MTITTLTSTAGRQLLARDARELRAGADLLNHHYTDRRGRPTRWTVTRPSTARGELRVTLRRACGASAFITQSNLDHWTLAPPRPAKRSPKGGRIMKVERIKE